MRKWPSAEVTSHTIAVLFQLYTIYTLFTRAKLQNYQTFNQEFDQLFFALSNKLLY